MPLNHCTRLPLLSPQRALERRPVCAIRRGWPGAMSSERFSPAFCRTLRPGSSTVPLALAVMFLTRSASSARDVTPLQGAPRLLMRRIAALPRRALFSFYPACKARVKACDAASQPSAKPRTNSSPRFVAPGAVGFVPAVASGATVLRGRPRPRFLADVLPGGRPSFLGRPRGRFAGVVVTMVTSSAFSSAIARHLSGQLPARPSSGRARRSDQWLPVAPACLVRHQLQSSLRRWFVRTHDTFDHTCGYAIEVGHLLNCHAVCDEGPQTTVSGFRNCSLLLVVTDCPPRSRGWRSFRRTSGNRCGRSGA
jgi:hypothetical protein